MYKESKQEHNSSARTHFLWTRYFTRYSAARSPWLPSRRWHSHFSGCSCSSAGLMVFILPSDLLLVRLHHPQACRLPKDQPGTARGDAHLLPAQAASASPAVIGILLSCASCFAFILRPESNGSETSNSFLSAALPSCPISQEALRKCYSN